MASRKAKITKRIVDAVTPGQTVWDTDIAGFAIRCQRQSKTYSLKTRIAGRQRWFTIGKHGAPWNPTTARAEALSILAEIGQGKDPATKRDVASKEPDVQMLVERYLTEEIFSKKKPATQTQYEGCLRRLANPIIGKLKARHVSFADVAALHHKLRDHPYQANRTVAVLSAMFSWAELVGLRDRGTNPAKGIRKFREKQHDRFLSADELGNLGQTFEALLKSKEINFFAIAAIRLLIFSGARKSEILSLRWEYIDFEGARLLLPDSKTGKKMVQLSAPALEVLSTIPRLAGNPHVIVGKNDGAHLVNLHKPWKRICATAGIENVRVHDLRHSFASVAASGGATLQIVGKLLGHTQIATTERYSHLAEDPIKQANEEVGQKIAAMMRGKKAEIVQLKKGT